MSMQTYAARLPSEQIARLKEIAAGEFNTPSGVVRRALDNYLSEVERRLEEQKQQPELPLNVVLEDDEPLAVNFAKQAAPAKEGK